MTVAAAIIITAYVAAGLVLAAVVIGCFRDGWRG